MRKWLLLKKLEIESWTPQLNATQKARKKEMKCKRSKRRNMKTTTQPIPMQTMKNTNMTVMTLHTQAHACKHIDVLYSLNFRIHRIVKIRSGMHEIRSELKHTRPNLHSANWLSNLLYECTTHKAYPIKPHSTIALSLLAFLIQLTENYCDNMKVSEWIFANKTL